MTPRPPDTPPSSKHELNSLPGHTIMADDDEHSHGDASVEMAHVSASASVGAASAASGNLASPDMLASGFSSGSTAPPAYTAAGTGAVGQSLQTPDIASTGLKHSAHTQPTLVHDGGGSPMSSWGTGVGSSTVSAV